MAAGRGGGGGGLEIAIAGRGTPLLNHGSNDERPATKSQNGYRVTR